MEPEERKSQRVTRGQPPNRLGWTSESASQISKVSKFSSGSKSSEARYQRKIAETELAAAEEIAELERHAEARDLERKRELILKRMELQKAAAAEEAAVRLSLPPSSTTSLVGAPLTSDRSSPPPQVRSAVLTTRRLELLAKPRQLQRGRSVSPPRSSGHIELDRYSLQTCQPYRIFRENPGKLTSIPVYRGIYKIYRISKNRMYRHKPRSYTCGVL